LQGGGQGGKVTATRYSEWETKAFEATDAYFTSIFLLVSIVGLRFYQRLGITYGAAIIGFQGTVMLAFLFTMRFCAGFYRQGPTTDGHCPPPSGHCFVPIKEHRATKCQYSSGPV
jgi:hypothetical protein